MLTPSTLLGPYEIVAPLGAGGMGEVYRARDTRLGREVAVKVLPEAFASNPDRLARFEREARAVAALSHPNILAIHDYDTHGAITYAVMELLEGETLRSRLGKGPLSWREAVEIGAAIAEGLAAAHGKGIVHRDLKPENLFLTSDGRVKILDFGLARITALPNAHAETGPYVPAETDAGTVMGTVGYMSPEQVRGQAADARSDIFSFGCVFYEMVTGRRAFQRETAAETMTAILHDEPLDPTDSDSQVPAELGRVIRQCLAKSPNQRLQSARDLAIGLRATASDPALHRAPPTRPFSSRLVAAVAAALLIGVIGASVYFLNKNRNPSGAPKPAEQAKAIESVAVLPFENKGGDPNTEPLSESIPETVIQGLSRLRLRDLKVKSLLSVARYKGRKPDLEEVRRELDVGAVVTGTLRQQGDYLIISVALTDVRDGSMIWGDKYKEKLGDILTLQDRISKDIATNLRLKLTGEEERRLTMRGTNNPDAYQLYSSGRFYWNRRTPDGMRKAIACFEDAIKLDRNYALAFAGLADVYAVFPFNSDELPSKYFPKAIDNAQKALMIDAQLGEAYAALAWVKGSYEWKWREAEELFKRAIDLNPNYGTAHQWYGGILLFQGRFDESREQHRLGRDLDPFSLINLTMVGREAFFLGKYDDAIAQYSKPLEKDPQFWVARVFLGEAYIENEEFERGLRELREGAQTGHLESLSMQGRAYALMGRRADALKVIDELKALRPTRNVPPCRLALVYAGLKENEQALDWLDIAFEEKDRLLNYLKIEPAYKDLRPHPRFAELLRKVGLVEKVAERDQAIRSLAVLPFVYNGGDPKTRTLSETLAGHIIDSLQHVRRSGLAIRPPSSVSRYSSQQRPDNPTISKKLNVQVIVTGTLRDTGDDELTITVEVVDAPNDVLLSTPRRYTSRRGKNPALDLQDRIVKEVAADLGLRLSKEEEQLLTRRGTADTKAYELYREAMYHFNKFSPEGLTAAIHSCKQAIERDPNYALPHAALARCYILQGTIYLGPKKTFPDARREIEEALRLDRNLADAHSAKGATYLFDDWNWRAAEQEVSLALDLDPNVFTTRNIYGFCLAAQGRFSEALTTIQRGQELDPLSAARRNEVAICYNAMHRYDEAIVEARKAIELDPNFFLAYGELGLAYSQQKSKHDEAIKALRTAVERGKGHPRMKGLLGYAYAAAGQKEEAQKELNALLADRKFGTAFAFVRIYAAFGEKEDAFKWLQEALDERDSAAIWIKFDPTLDSLRSDPRFAQVLKDMRLPP